MPKGSTFNSTCSIAWTCTSPPGEPNGITPPSRCNKMAGFGVSRGRLPGATAAGCRGSVRLCDPRDEGTIPSPGTIGDVFELSDGVALKALPQRSTTQT